MTEHQKRIMQFDHDANRRVNWLARYMLIEDYLRNNGIYTVYKPYKGRTTCIEIDNYFGWKGVTKEIVRNQHGDWFTETEYGWNCKSLNREKFKKQKQNTKQKSNSKIEV